MSEDTLEAHEAYVEGEKQCDAVFRPIMAHLEAALTSHRVLGDLARDRHNPTQRTVWTHHHGYLRERLEDIRIISGRMRETKREFARRHAQEELSGVIDIPLGISLPTQMRLDFESLYIFGNLALDQLVMLIRSLTGEPTGSDFHQLLVSLQSLGYSGVLRPLWERHRSDIVWLYYQVRCVRNHFIEHLRVAFQRSTVVAFYGPEVELFMPALVDDGSIPSIGEASERAIRELGSRYVAHIPSEMWNRYGFPYVLRLVFNSIAALSTQAEREQVWDACRCLGVHVPSYHVIGVRLARFLDESLRDVIEIIGADTKH